MPVGRKEIERKCACVRFDNLRMRSWERKRESMDLMEHILFDHDSDENVSNDWCEWCRQCPMSHISVYVFGCVSVKHIRGLLHHTFAANTIHSFDSSLSFLFSNSTFPSMFNNNCTQMKIEKEEDIKPRSSGWEWRGWCWWRGGDWR